ncbi:MAG TPA: hypothetical protein DCQ31_13510 [Bacteroidales bacterium]|nr:hypothetical protein [Bacteroidales bacterium]
MINKLLVTLSLIVIPLVAISQQTKKETFRLFFLGGQSNMEGHGLNSELPDSLRAEFKNVWIFNGFPAADEDKNGGLGKWEKLKSGNGAGFFSDGKNNKLSAKFGIELSFAKRLQELYPNDKIALIKYARGGSSIDSSAAREYGSWEFDYKGIAGMNQFDHFLTTVNGALQSRDIDGNGVEDELIPQGIIWMQGESDAITEPVALRYYDNLKRLMDLIRATFRINDLPVVIGKISDSGLDNNGKTWPYGEQVQYAQEKYVKTDRKAAIVRSTMFYKYSDPWHYDSTGYIDLGKKFAEAVFQINK